MTHHLIRLPANEWAFDDTKLLGHPGGFGEVFRGRGASADVAIKRLLLTAAQAAHRELNIGEHLVGKSFTNIVPILDAGQDSESERYFLVMPICDRNLQEEIEASNGRIDLSKALPIVCAILQGLREIPEITHRDLKPSNVLLHDGVWKIADFGIAKFVEDSTSLETLRNCRTPTYAAPEQWRGERPTEATDVYAIGCIIHTLLTGAPPFSGSIDDLREKHLHGDPKNLDELPPWAAGFVTLMLRKSPDARPTLKRCFERFSEFDERLMLTKIQRALGRAGRDIAEAEAQSEAFQKAENARLTQRRALAAEANVILEGIRSKLFTEIKEHAESAAIGEDELRLGSGILKFAIQHSNFSHAEFPRWDIVTASTISLTVATRLFMQFKWSASLIYTRPTPNSDYRWHEVGFFNSNRHDRNEPHSVSDIPQLQSALQTRGSQSHHLAYNPIAIDTEDEGAFLDRWRALLAKAAVGALHRPHKLPLDFRYLLR